MYSIPGCYGGLKYPARMIDVLTTERLILEPRTVEDLAENLAMDLDRGCTATSSPERPIPKRIAGRSSPESPHAGRRTARSALSSGEMPAASPVGAALIPNHVRPSLLDAFSGTTQRIVRIRSNKPLRELSRRRA
jgi:hypothetical protein